MIPVAPGLGYEGKRMVEGNLDDIFLSGERARLTVGDPHYTISSGRFDCKDRKRNSIRAKLGYFYHEGPEFRIDYIHEQVEY
ncbi:hypothetical protein BCON_0040g00010 [Botryotinia convoluta]|uniref:Uncharacterized protein n=1 Tax=Botryotinia convoluta TaxID=54673 RepID=A0A4Z1IEI0_9HELO|nr:hypothetical protein BCON_0040g00010 [Botryotinia convoluta]